MGRIYPGDLGLVRAYHRIGCGCGCGVGSGGSRVNLLVDGDCAAATADAWTALNAVLSKSDASGVRALRIAYDGANAMGRAYQDVCVPGGATIIGKARGDGVAAWPYIRNAGGGILLDTFTTSTSWQPFSFTAALDGVRVFFVGGDLSTGGWVEFTQLTIYQP